MRSKTKKMVFLSDTHVPDHDPAVLRLIKTFIDDFQPNIVCHLGDLLSIDQFSSYPSDSNIDLDYEFECGTAIFEQLGVTHFAEGNHEQRLRRPNIDKRIRKVIDWKKNLHIKELGIKTILYDNKSVFKFGKLKAVHGFNINEHCAKKHAETYGCVVFGHTHRVQMFQPKQAFSDHTGFNIGCTCKLNLAYSLTRPVNGWGQAFAWGYLYPNGHFDLYICKLIGKTHIIEGVEYTL